MVAVAAVASKYDHELYAFRFPSYSSIFAAELRAILLAPRQLYHSKGKSFLVLSDSSSSLHAFDNVKYDYPIPVKKKNHELYSDLIRDGKEIVFVWVPGHVGIRDNSAVGFAAKDALDGDVFFCLI